MPFEIHSDIIGEVLKLPTKKTKTISKENEYKISDNIHVLGNIIDMRLFSHDEELLNQIKLVTPISYEYFFGAPNIGTNYLASYVDEGKMYAVTQGQAHMYTFRSSKDEMDNEDSPTALADPKML